MPEEPKPPTGETPAQPAQDAGTPGTQVPETTTPPAAEEPFDKERAMQTINKLRDIEKKAKQDAKELETLRAERDKRIQAEMTEAQKAQARAEKAEQENAKLQMDIFKRDVIAETGLPAAFADRLKGSTKEELLADAQELLKVIPQQPPKPPPHLNATNPGGASAAETDAQKRERLFGKQKNIFDMNAIREGGGGVVWGKPSEK